MLVFTTDNVLDAYVLSAPLLDSFEFGRHIPAGGTLAINLKGNATIVNGATVLDDNVRITFGDRSGNDFTVSVDGNAGFTASDPNPFSAPATTFVGTDGTGTSLDGYVAELIVFNASQVGTPSEKQVESYLASKYGITLDPVAASYVASDSSIIWDYIPYWNDVTVIGRDDLTDLDQRISRSVNNLSQVTIAHGTDSDLSDNTDPRAGLTPFADNYDFPSYWT